MKFTLSTLFILILTIGDHHNVFEADIIITNVNVIDVVNGRIIPNRSVAINGERVSDIYAPNTKKINSQIQIDGSDKYLMPGLWDMHAHYNWNYGYSSLLLVANGVTGIREMWGVTDSIKNIRNMTSDKMLIGPDIYSAGSIIDGMPPIWAQSSGVSNASEALTEVNNQIAAGVDFLKVYSRLSKDAYMAIAKRSKELNVPFAGHIPESVTMWEALEANQQSAEHFYGFLEACSNSKQEELDRILTLSRFSDERARFLVDTFDRDRFDSLKAAMAKSNTWLSPTLIVFQNMANLDDSSKRNDPRLSYMPQFVQQMWDPQNSRDQNRGSDYYEALRKKFNLQLSLIGDLEKAGVKIIAGTDYPNSYTYPGFSLHDELELLVKGGMSNASALKAATYNPAVLMNREDEMGEVLKGKLASLVLLNSNPLNDITNTKQIETVFLRGQYLPRKTLDSLLIRAKNISAKTRSSF